MRTRTRKIDDPNLAAEILQSGGIVAFPTETVYGLGVDATNADAVDRLFAAKGRPTDNPLIVHLADWTLWNMAAKSITESAAALLKQFSPGPITVVLPKRDEICNQVTAGLASVGIRVPRHDAALEILRSAGIPIAAPSANNSGRPSCTTWQSVLEDLDGKVDAVFESAPCSIGLESTVVDCRDETPIVLRAGGVSTEQIRNFFPQTTINTKATSGGSIVSPGTHHAHYQPSAVVHLVQSDFLETDAARKIDTNSAFCGLRTGPNSEAGNLPLELCQLFENTDAYAQGFYELLREVDRRGIKNVYIEIASGDGLSTALRDRQFRAAGQ